MFRLALLAGLLALAQYASADSTCNAGTQTHHTASKCEGFSFFSPTTEGYPGGTGCLQNVSYEMDYPNCQYTDAAVGIYAKFYTCPNATSDGKLVFESDFGEITIDANSCNKTAPLFVGYGDVLNFTLIQGKTYFNFMLVLSTNNYTVPTTTTVVTTPAIPTKATVPSTKSGAKLDLIIVLDEIYNRNSSLPAINKIVTSFVDLVHPTIVADPLSGIRINPIFVGQALFSQANWQMPQQAFLSMVNAFMITAGYNSMQEYGLTDYTPVTDFLDSSFGPSNKNVRDHTTRAMLIFTSNDSNKTALAENFITKAQQYDVHTIVVPVDSDVTNINEQLRKYPDVSTKPLFYEAIDSTSYNATEVAEDLFQNYLLNGNKLCNVKCVASGNDFKFPNVPTAFKGNHYCANTKGFRCSLKEIFAKSISSGNFAANVFAATTAKPAAPTTAKPAAGTTAKPAAGTTAKPGAGTTAKPAAGTTAKPGAVTTANPTGCSLDKEVTVKLTEYDINTGFDTLNFYEVTEIERSVHSAYLSLKSHFSFTGFAVKNSQFKANLSDAYFVFNSVPSSVYGGFELSISC
uniref:VWFA domain-containing protein n=1 Tax=Steinernema glaseri TaxID=37863 RepID=A0A1I7YDW1_9BILA